MGIQQQTDGKLPNQLALDEVERFLENPQSKTHRPTVKVLAEYFSKIPYGWNDWDMAGILTLLMREGKLTAKSCVEKISLREVCKLAKRICPRCGSRETAPILWGMPAYTEKLQEQLNNKEILLGGCCITENDPTHHCFKCKKDFGRKTADLETDTIEVNFEIGGFFQGYNSLIVKKTNNGAITTCTQSFDKHSDKELSFEEWDALLKSLYRCYICDWKKRYVDNGVLDGTQWELTIQYANHKPLNIYGSNAYPPHWNKLMKAMKNLVPIDF